MFAFAEAVLSFIEWVGGLFRRTPKTPEEQTIADAGERVHVEDEVRGLGDAAMRGELRRRPPGGKGGS
jgi:hypothetical protein